MKKLLTARNLTVAGAILFCTALLFLVFNQSADPDCRKGHGNGETTNAASTKPGPTQQMPDSTLRPLTLRIPVVGRVNGSRWLPGHQFQTIGRDSLSPFGNLPLDVLVDAEGHFLAARRGGTRYDTRMSDISMTRLFQYAIYEEYNRRQQRLTGPILPAVSRVSLVNMTWDDPQLGDAIKHVMNNGYVRADPFLEKTLSRFEDTYYFFEVQFEGEANPRHIAVRRYSEGKVWMNKSDGPMTFPALPDPYICNTNINGAGVFYIVREHHLTDWREPSWLFLTEPWDGPCPWPEDRLDPNVGHDRLNEFFFPDEAPVGQMPDILNFSSLYPIGADKPFVERAQKNKAARLASETGGSGSSGR